MVDPMRSEGGYDNVFEEYREPPAFNVPWAVGTLLLLIVGSFLLMQYLPVHLQERALLLFSLIPLRYSSDALASLPGGELASLWTPLTYTFLHGGWEHLGANAIWLLAFGSPVVRRFGALRFFLFYFFCGAAGAFLHVWLYADSFIPVVGASAAISGLMGGAVRFVFLADGPFGAMGGAGSQRVPGRRAGIIEVFQDRRVLIFVAVWIGLNFLLGSSALSGIFGSGSQIAWEAHLGGFLAGLFCFSLFDPLHRSPSGGPGNVGYGEWLGKEPHE